jgi:hypothetical protein
LIDEVRELQVGEDGMSAAMRRLVVERLDRVDVERACLDRGGERDDAQRLGTAEGKRSPAGLAPRIKE